MSDFIEYGWEDEIVNEGNEFPLLPEGDYNFTISKVERARHGGSEKIPPCNMAKVTFTIWGEEDKVEITENFYLCNKFEWKLSALFLAIGMKKHGEPLKMNWNAVPNKTGKCHVYIDTYYKQNDDRTKPPENKSNKIKKLYAYDEKVDTIQPVKSQPANTNNTAAGGWKPGVF